MSKGRSRDMKNKTPMVFFILFFFILGVVLTACNDNQSVTVPISQKAVAFKKKVKKTFSDSLKARQATQKKTTLHPMHKPASLKIEAAKNGEIKKINYKSSIMKLRDPFVPFIKFNEKSAGQKVKKPLLPLQRYALSQLTLVAIIDAGKKGRWAMVQDSSGKGFTVHEGMPIGSGGGIIKKIQTDQLIIEQKKIDLLGKKKVNLIAIKLHPEKKEE